MGPPFRVLRLFALGAITTVVVATLLVSPAVRGSAEVSLGYHADQSIPIGSLVSLNFANATQVVPATTESANYLVGIVNVPDDSLLTWSDSASNIDVATGGIVSTLVSTLGGPIRKGDRIMASPYPGIGMKATPGARVIGVATTGFTDLSGTSQEVKDAKGKARYLTVGQIPVQIQILTWGGSETGLAALVPPYIQTLADTVASKHASPLRIVLAILVLLAALLLAVVILVTAVRASMIAIGRNPLSAGNIQKGFVRVIMITSGLLVTGLIAVIAILKI